MKLFLTLIVSFISLATFGQQDKQKIVRAFDKVEYYNDTTVKQAYRTRFWKKHGYAVEFSEDGKPIAIGRYSKGKKWSWWIYPDNRTDHYNYYGFKGGPDNQPLCLTGQPHDFNRLYKRLLAGEKYP